MPANHTVASVMTYPVVTVTPDTTFKEVVRLLRRRRVSGLPVVDPAGKLVGIISEADLLNKVEKRESESYLLESKRHRLDRARAEALDVGSAMSTSVVTVQPEFPIALAAREMHTRGFKRLPVVNAKGELVGIVSRGDLLTVFLRTDREIRAEVRELLRRAATEHGGRGLKARITNGVVELEGSFQEKSRCDATVRAVAATEGVVGVQNRMSYKIDDTPTFPFPSASEL
jgi:CBS domain-containing protein